MVIINKYRIEKTVFIKRHYYTAKQLTEIFNFICDQHEQKNPDVKFKKLEDKAGRKNNDGSTTFVILFKKRNRIVEAIINKINAIVKK